MHRQICVWLGVVCLTVALTSPARGQYGNPYELEPMQPYGGTGYDPLADHRERMDRLYEREARQRALQNDYAKPPPPAPFSDYGAPCDFMTGNAAAQQRCYESRQ